MKELSIEEKAKAYDEVISRAKKFYTPDSNNANLKATLEMIFPELTESEDERIRKDIVTYLKSILSNKKYGDKFIESWIAWLEKQGEQPKKVSIWKHWKDGIAGNAEGKLIYLVKVGNTYNLSSCLNFECDYIELSELDSLMLEKQAEQKPAFEMKTPEESLGIDSDTYNKVVDECIYGEQKSAWSEEDTQYINDTLALLSFGCSIHSVGEVQKWLQSLNNRVQLKPEWSEEDLYKIENALFGTYAADVATKLLNKIKSSYWKPSDEQMDALRYVTNFDYGGYKAILVSLYEQLKKL